VGDVVLSIVLLLSLLDGTVTIEFVASLIVSGGVETSGEVVGITTPVYTVRI